MKPPWNTLEQAGTCILLGLHKTGIRGIQDTRQIVDGKTNDKENNDKQAGAELCQAEVKLKVVV